MNTAWRAPIRALVVCLALMLPMLAAASSASGAVVINEVESDAGAGSDFVELFNTGAAAVDISGYVLKDSGEGNNFTVPAGTTIAPGGFYATDVSGLGSSDSARLFAPADGAIPVDSYSWTSHAAATYGRCPDGTGAFTSTSSATKGTANDCPVAASTWPGGSAIGIADGASVFGSNLSGLTYQPSGSGVPGVLWAVRNGPSTLFRLVWDGTKWTPDTANGWSAGKQLVYTDGTGVPDAEGVTLAGGDPNGIFVSTERNDNGADSNTSRPAVLRYDVSSSNTTLNATRDWNLTVDLPGLGANLGLEAVTWVPDDVLVSKGFLDDTATPYNPATYADHGTGLFFVGVEQDGRIIAYALNQTTGAFTRVASIASGFPKVMELQYEPETTHLWAVCDDTCNGRHATLDIAQSGPNDGHFVVTGTFERPGGMPNLNNEGFAIAPQAECVGGLKPVFWADDGNTGSHALRAGTLNCTVPPAGPAPDRDGDGKPDSSDSCPDVAAATADGCPAAPADRDGDGKPDSSDACPDVAAATANGCPAPVGATAGNDTLNGDSGPNVICGLLGNDVINGLQGNDTLFGDACNDKVKVIAARAAVDGNDKLNGAEGNDTLYGAGGMDSLSGGAGNDKLFGGDGNDSLEGGAGNDKLDGGRGNDKLTGGPGVNSYSGGPGNDTVNARNHKKETVDCGSGKKDVATVDKNDKVKGCEKVRRAK